MKAYEEDFKTERHDRERAHDKFSDREKEWIEQRERLTRTIFTLQDQLVSREREVRTVQNSAYIRTFMISGVIRCGVCVCCSFMLLTYASSTKYVYI